MRWPAFFVWARLVLAFAALLAAGVSTQRFTLTLQPVVLEIVIRALSVSASDSVDGYTFYCCWHWHLSWEEGGI